MQVTFLGTGSAMPVPERVQTGLLLEGTDRPLLVDCGAGILHRLSEIETGYEDVSTVLLTHHHLDHIADLLPLLKARWLAGETHLEIAGPPGTKSLVDQLLDVHDYLEGKVDLSLREVHADSSFSLAGYDIDAFQTRHSMDCLAYRFADNGQANSPESNTKSEPEDDTIAESSPENTAEENDNKGTQNASDNSNSKPSGSFTYSGDSEAFSGLANFADGSRVLAHDCSFPDGIDVSNHPTPTQLGESLAGTDIDRLYLTHRYPHTEGKDEQLRESVRNAGFNGEVRLAADGLRVTI